MGCVNGSVMSDSALTSALETVSSVGGVCFVQAESGALVAANEKRLLARGVTGPEGHLAARPEENEEHAVNRLCAIAQVRNDHVKPLWLIK